MRVFFRVPRGQADIGKGLGNTRARICWTSRQMEGLGDDAFDGMARIEAAVGVLENDLHFAAQISWHGWCDRLSVEGDLTVLERFKPKDCAG